MKPKNIGSLGVQNFAIIATLRFYDYFKREQDYDPAYSNCGRP